MEDKKGGFKNLQDLKKELQTLTQQESIQVKGGRTWEKDKWTTSCSNIIPQ